MRVARGAGLRRLGHDRRGITAWEYALIGAIIVVAIVGSLNTIATATMSPFIFLNTKIASPP